MFRIPRIFLCRQLLRSTVRRYKKDSLDLQGVKILSSDDDDFIKIAFKYGNVPHSNNFLSFKVDKEQSLGEVRQRIKNVVNLQRKKEVLRKSVVRKYSSSSDVLEDDVDENIDVVVIKDDIVIEDTVKNAEAWTHGSLLKIGDMFLEIHHNSPTVQRLSLPDHIIAGCIIRPHFRFECAVFEDCEFKWFREIGNEDNIEKNWQKVSEGFIYEVSPEDIGHKLKLICTPKRGENFGNSFTAISKNEVESGPDLFPFEERHHYTKDLADSDCIRCVTYNILANVYVDNKKFPYCTVKAGDNYYRKQLLLKEILGYNADILCLQEVQERIFDYDIMPVLSKVNLNGYYNKKNGRRHEGVAFFYRTTKFKVINQQTVYLNEIVKDREVTSKVLSKVSGNYKDMSKLLMQDTVLQTVLLQHLDQPKKRILVANTHLYSNKDKPEVRLIQAALSTSYMEHILKSEDKDSTAVIFCGDFNSLPGSAAHQYIMDGSFQCCSSWKNNSVGEDTDMNLRHNLLLDSACGTPKYTNYTQEFYGCLDYIFYSKNILDVSEVVPMPSHSKVTEQVALPSELFPSDHIPLICTLKWKAWNDTS